MEKLRVKVELVNHMEGFQRDLFKALIPAIVKINILIKPESGETMEKMVIGIIVSAVNDKLAELNQEEK